jgi:cytochrome c oxidase assembly protein subunit 15
LVSDLRWPVSFLGAVAIVLGVIVTGAGPHAGDAHTTRSGFDIETVEHWHSYPAYLLLVLVIIQLSRLLPADRTKPFRQWRRATQLTLGLLLLLIAQALVGIIQARLHVPPVLVAWHMLQAACAVALLTWQNLSLKKS